ncbi:MAG: hypothetical protein GX564_12410 [Oligosphaeraceae bacterium]|nr:hypothetical protein [Oligosphaeraceae bacterium]
MSIVSVDLYNVIPQAAERKKYCEVFSSHDPAEHRQPLAMVLPLQGPLVRAGHCLP